LLIRGSGVERSGRAGVGRYFVTFNRDVNQCLPVVSLEDKFLTVGIDPATPLVPRGIDVEVIYATSANSGTAEDSEFFLAVFC